MHDVAGDGDLGLAELACGVLQVLAGEIGPLFPLLLTIFPALADR